MNPVLVEIYRGGILESFHRGAVCIVNEANQVVFSTGDPHQVCYPRSAMKLLQVIPLLENGGIARFNFSLEELAVMCGSHNAEPEHVAAVESILAKAGLTVEALQCGPQYPSSKKEANELVRQNKKPQPVHNNCSGKHAGMLAMCILMGWSVENYLNLAHPLQQAILHVCSEMYEYPQERMTTALDGCSAPIFSVPVYQQAIGYKNLVNPERFSTARQEACRLITEAVSRHPFMVAGSNRYCTDMMHITAPSIIGKTGAEGVFCMGFTTHKLGVCIKIDDGKMLPQYNVAQAIVNASGLFAETQLAPLQHYLHNDITNFNKWVTGEIRVNEQLVKELKKVSF